jgi:transposase
MQRVYRVAQVARRQAMNADMIFNWLRDPRYALGAEWAEGDTGVADIACFLPVESVDQSRSGDTLPATCS